MNPRKALRPLLGGGLFLWIGVLAFAEQPLAQIAFVHKQWIQMSAGFFIPGQGWVAAEQHYAPAQPADTISLFDLQGKVGEVRVIDPRRPDPDGVPVAWSAAIERWTPRGEPFALGVMGSWPAPASVPVALPLDDPDALKAASDFLK